MLEQNQKKELIHLIKKLGKKTEKIKMGMIDVFSKDDLSPLTQADILVNQELNKFILNTNIKNIISEENKEIDYSVRKKWKLYWHIDPIDGTKEFINKGDDYTINIALCLNASPIFSIVYAPARLEMFTAEKDKGAFKNQQQVYTFGVHHLQSVEL